MHATPSGRPDTIHPGMQTSLAGQPGARFSAELRATHPEDAGTIHPRAREMAETMRELAGSNGNATEQDLRCAGFSIGEIIEHMPAAQTVIHESFVRHAPPPGDKVPEIIEKALASAAHRVPATAGHEPTEDNHTRWRAYCAARAAFKLDPWVSQGERTLVKLKHFLAGLPLLEGEVNRVVFAIAAEQKHTMQRHHTIGKSQ